MLSQGEEESLPNSLRGRETQNPRCTVDPRLVLRACHHKLRSTAMYTCQQLTPSTRPWDRDLGFPIITLHYYSVTCVLKISHRSTISKGGKAAAARPSPAVHYAATAVATYAGRPVRAGGCSSIAAACCAGMPIPAVHREATAVTGCAGKRAVGSASRVTEL